MLSYSRFQVWSVTLGLGSILMLLCPLTACSQTAVSSQYPVTGQSRADAMVENAQPSDSDSIHPGDVLLPPDDDADLQSERIQENIRNLIDWKGGKLPPATFFRILGPPVRTVAKKTRVPASVTLAQAALETHYGKATIGSAKNLFGIKGTGPAGSVIASTREHVNNKWVTVRARFKKYHSWEESIEKHAEFLTRNSRYRNAFNYCKNADRFAREIHKAGYATDPKYSNSLIALMKQFDLYKWNE